QRLGEHSSAESRFSQRASRGRIEARRDPETAKRSGGGGYAGKMDRAASPTIQRPHAGNHARNRLRVGTAQRVAPNSTGRWFARSNRTGSSANVRDAQHKKRGRIRHLPRESVEMTLSRSSQTRRCAAATASRWMSAEKSSTQSQQSGQK